MSKAEVIAAGLFETGPDGASLIGTRCQGCGTLYFPQAVSCRNPVCENKRVERSVLPQRGILVGYTVQRYRPPELFRIDNWQPYVIGLVDLGDGLEVMGILDVAPSASIRVGLPVRVKAFPLFEDEARGEVLTYAFAAADPTS